MHTSRSSFLIIAACAWSGLAAQPKADVNATLDTAADPAALQGLDRRVMNLYDRHTLMAYAIANNADGIEVLVRANDPATVRQILRAGMSIALDTTGRKGDTPRIDFPLPGMARMHREGAEGGGQRQPGPPPAPNMDQVNARFRVEGFNGASGELPITNEQGIRVRAEMGTQEVLTVGYWIPYDALLGHDVQPGTEHKAWRLTVCVNALEFHGGGGGQGGGGGMHRGMGGGGMGGGGMRGGGMGGMRGGGGMGGGMRSGGGAQSGTEQKRFRVTFAQAPVPGL